MRSWHCVAGRRIIEYRELDATLGQAVPLLAPRTSSSDAALRLENQGKLIHLDIKTLTRSNGVRNRSSRSNSWGVARDYVQDCIDDVSRVGFTNIFPHQMAPSASAFVAASVACYNSLGVTVTRVMTDNGWRCKAFAVRDCKYTDLSHIRSRPFTPRTNGLAERFIKTTT